jgi:hypothetical protein
LRLRECCESLKYTSCTWNVGFHWRRYTVKSGLISIHKTENSSARSILFDFGNGGTYEMFRD